MGLVKSEAIEAGTSKIAVSALGTGTPDGTKFLRDDQTWATPSTGGVSDGDKGDITVSASGATWTIDASAVTTTKMGGDVTTAGKALLTAADAAAQRTALALGTAAQSATGDFAAAVHTHAASAITSGTVDTARLGSGTANSTTYLRGDQTWASVTATDPDGYTYIVASGNQDVTNAGVTNHNEFSFATTANALYAITMDLFIAGNNTTADFTMDLRVDAGTMTGKGTVQNLTAAAAVQNIIMTAAAAANTTAIATGAPTASLNDPVAVRVAFACSVSNSTTFRFRFGNATPTTGATSRVLKGSIFRYKSLT